jgi:hypothetical protein
MFFSNTLAQLIADPTGFHLKPLSVCGVKWMSCMCENKLSWAYACCYVALRACRCELYCSACQAGVAELVERQVASCVLLGSEICTGGMQLVVCN